MGAGDSLTSKQISATYKDILQVPNSNSGVDATTRLVMDGEGTESALQLSTTAVKSTGTLESTGNTTVGGSLILGAQTLSATATELNLLDGITAVDTDITSVSASDDTLASAKSIKTYVDAQILTKDNLDEIAEGTTNVHFTATDNTKLDGIEASATADQTGAEIKTAYEAEAETNAFTDAEKTSLGTMEDNADVTDTTNVTSAGALMDSELTDLDGVKSLTVPNSTTISAFGATLVDDADAAAARTTLGASASGHTHSYAALGANSDITSLTGLTTDLAITHGGTGAGTAQAAIDSLSAVSGATNEHVLTKDTSTGNATWKAAAGGGASALDDLTDVNIGTPGSSEDNYVLKYNNSTSKWIAAVDSTSGGAGGAAGDTGEIQYNSADSLAASSNLFWDNSNNRLGIGASPDRTLHVDSGSTDTVALFQSSADANAYINIEDANTVTAPQIGAVTDALVLRTSNTPAITIDSSQNVGIGLTPNETLEVAGNIKCNASNGEGFILNSSTTTGIFRQNADELGITVGGSERMRIDNSGVATLTNSNSGLVLKNSGASDKEWRVGGGSASQFQITEVGVADRFIISAGGNVGIGGTAGNKLHVICDDDDGIRISAGTAAAHGDKNARILALNTAGTFYNDLELRASETRIYSDGTAALTIDSSGNVGTPSAFHVTNGGSHTAGNAIYSPASNEMGISTNAVERIRIDSSGNVIIKSGSAAQSASSLNFLSTNYGSYGPTHAVESKITSQNVSTADAYSSVLTFHTNSTTDVLTERMRIDSSGNVGIGASPDTYSTGQTALQIGNQAAIMSQTASTAGGELSFSQNAFLGNDGGANEWFYKVASDEAARYTQSNGTHKFYVASAGAAEAAVSQLAVALGRKYVITETGGDFHTNFGAASDAVGVVFTATASGTGSGGKVREVPNWTTAMTIDSSGNVGIGGAPTSSGQLDVLSSNTSTSIASPAGAGISLRNTHATDNNYSFIRFDAANGNIGSGIFGITTDQTPTLGELSFGTADSGGITERMRIDSSGVVKLNQADESEIAFRRNNTGTAMDCGKITFGDNTDARAQIQGETTTTSDDGELTFSTADGGTLAERMRIDSSGNVNVGEVAYLGKSNLIAQIAVNRLPSDGTIPVPSSSAAFINLNGAAEGSTIEFATADAADTGPTERMRIDSSGRVIVKNASNAEVSALSQPTVTPDFDVANNFSITLTDNRALTNPDNPVAGQSGIITITQDGTGSRTLSYGSYWMFEGGTAPTLTTTASAVDLLVYYAESADRITAKLIKDTK